MRRVPIPALMQRLLALGALLIASLVHINTVRADSSVGQRLADEEVESLGADALQSTFDRIAALPFDAEADADDPEDLTPIGQFGRSTWAAATDLDDLDGATTTVQVGGPEGTGSFDFVVTATVEYVEKSGTAWVSTGGNRQWFKRVTLRATGPSRFAATLSSVYAAEGV